MMGDDASISTAVAPIVGSVSCLSWAAILVSTTVQDSDGDGLLDVWEKSGLTDIADGSFVNLPVMGADPNVKDIFVDIDYMTTSGYTTTGQGTVPRHMHLPTQAALDMVGDAFKAQGINIHFDVGNIFYQGDPYVVPGTLSRGGNAINEPTCDPSATTCLFPDYPGTVSWKTGFQQIKDGDSNLSIPRSFDHNRRDIFHYVLFAHTVGLPKWRMNDGSLVSIVVSGNTATVTTGSALASTPSSVTVIGAPASSNLNGTHPVTAAKGATLTITVASSTVPGMYQNWGTCRQ
jgi:hypothetical protein